MNNYMNNYINRKFGKRKTYWVADLGYMQLIITFYYGIYYPLTVIDIYSKYAWIVF